MELVIIAGCLLGVIAAGTRAARDHFEALIVAMSGPETAARDAADAEAIREAFEEGRDVAALSAEMVDRRRREGESVFSR